MISLAHPTARTDKPFSKKHGESAIYCDVDDEDEDEDVMGQARGAVNGLVLGSVIWVTIALTWWAL